MLPRLPRIVAGCEGDALGEPAHDPVYYLELARAAYAAGPYATALVRQDLAAQSPRPLRIFNQDIEALGRVPAKP